MAYNDTAGAKYEATKDLSRAELKKVILADVKAALPAGVKATLRNPHYSSFTITLSGIKNLVNPEFMKAQALGTLSGYIPNDPKRYLPEAAALIQKVEEIAGAYNYDKSDIQTDYFNVRFYLDVKPNRDEEEAACAAILEAHSPVRRVIRKVKQGALGIANDKLIEMGGLPQFKGRFPNKKPMKPLLTLNEKEHGGYRLAHLVGTICGPEAKAKLVADLSFLEAELKRKDGDWNEPLETEEAEMGAKLRAGYAAEEAEALAEVAEAPRKDPKPAFKLTLIRGGIDIAC